MNFRTMSRGESGDPAHLAALAARIRTFLGAHEDVSDQWTQVQVVRLDGSMGVLVDFETRDPDGVSAAMEAEFGDDGASIAVTIDRWPRRTAIPDAHTVDGTGCQITATRFTGTHERHHALEVFRETESEVHIAIVCERYVETLSPSWATAVRPERGFPMLGINVSVSVQLDRPLGERTLVWRKNLPA